MLLVTFLVLSFGSINETIFALINIYFFFLSRVTGKNVPDPFCSVMHGCAYHNCMDACGGQYTAPVCVDPDHCCCYPIGGGVLAPN